MSILEEIRQKAAEKKQAEQQQNLREQKLEKIYQQILLPKMQFMYNNLKELVEYLNFLEEPIPVTHYCRHYPQFGTLYQKNYKLNTDGRMGMADYQRLMQINISFFCEAEGSFSYSLSSKSLIEKEYAFLFDRGLRFQQKNYRFDKAQFVVERKIPVRFQLVVDYATSKLRVNIFNHENFLTFHKNFTVDQLDDDFLESFLNYFMRRNNDFVRSDITPEQKAAILDHIAPYYEEQKPIFRELSDLFLEEGENAVIDPVKKIFTKLNKP